jgi:3-oxoacyl-[acyl-carrier-protein] synthase II
MATDRRVVVTGLGIVSPVGNNISTAWQNIVQGISGVGLIDSFDLTNFNTKFAGLIKNFVPENYMPAKEIKRCDQFIQYGIAAGIDALKDAGFDVNQQINLDRAGIIIGSGIGGISSIEQTNAILMKDGPRRVSPFFFNSNIN